MVTLVNKNLRKGYLASYSKKGWLWLSKLCEMDYCEGCNRAVVTYNRELDQLEICPHESSGWVADTDVYMLIPIEDNGVVIRLLWFLDIAEARDLFGQYLPFYDKERQMICINLKERIKK